MGLAGGMNLYGFANGDPVNYSDPFGLFASGGCDGFWNCVAELAKMTWAGFKAGSDPTGLAPFDPDQGQGQFGYALGKLSMVAAGAGTVRFGGGGTATAAGTADAVSAVKLGKSLASQAQMTEAGHIMAGGSSRAPFRDAARVAAQYGGNAADWVKKTSSSYQAVDGRVFETHWVENLVTGLRVEFKTNLTR